VLVNFAQAAMNAVVQMVGDRMQAMMQMVNASMQVVMQTGWITARRSSAGGGHTAKKEDCGKKERGGVFHLDIL
jgi:hypothetical protein